MKIHVITIGQPKLPYAQQGWEEYWNRLKHYHQLRATHIADKNNDAARILDAAGTGYKVALVIKGKQMDSETLSDFLDKRALEGREVSFIIGGPDGLPKEVIAQSNLKWSMSELTFPHDLAMVVMLETLYRASTISAGQPYHR